MHGSAVRGLRLIDTSRRGARDLSFLHGRDGAAQKVRASASEVKGGGGYDHPLTHGPVFQRDRRTIESLMPALLNRSNRCAEALFGRSKRAGINHCRSRTGAQRRRPSSWAHPPLPFSLFLGFPAGRPDVTLTPRVGWPFTPLFLPAQPPTAETLQRGVTNLLFFGFHLLLDKTGNPRGHAPLVMTP